MAIAVKCACGHWSNVPDSDFDVSVRCPECGRIFRLSEATIALAQETPKPVLPLTAPLPRGESLAGIGWRIGAMLAFVGGCAPMLWRAAALPGPSRHDPYSDSGVQGFLGVLSLIVGICLAVGLWRRRIWARWTMIVFSAISAIALVSVAQSHHSSVAIGWYSCAVGTLVGWVLLLERRTTLAKLSAGIIVTLASQLGIVLIVQFTQ